MPRDVFAAGDIVVCLDDSPFAGIPFGRSLVKGKAYCVSSVSPNGDDVRLNGEHSGWMASRFRRATPEEISAFVSSTTQKPAASESKPVVILGQQDIQRANAAIAIPADGFLKSSDGREFGIVDWKPSSCLGEPVRVDVKLQPEVPVEVPAVAPATPGEGYRFLDPRFKAGDQVRVKCTPHLENGEPFGPSRVAIVDSVEKGGTVLNLIPMYSEKLQSNERGTPRTFFAEDVVPVDRDYYLLSQGDRLKEDDEWVFDTAFVQVGLSCKDIRYAPSVPVRRKKSKETRLTPKELAELANGGHYKLVGCPIGSESHSSANTPYWNPLMSRQLGKVVYVQGRARFGGGKEIYSIACIQDGATWNVSPEWLAVPTAEEVDDCQKSLAVVGRTIVAKIGGKPTVCRVVATKQGDSMVGVCYDNQFSEWVYWVFRSSILRAATRHEMFILDGALQKTKEIREKAENFAKDQQKPYIMGVDEGRPHASKSGPTITWNTPQSIPFAEMELEFRWEGGSKAESDAASGAFRGLQKAMKDKITIVSEGIKVEGVIASVASSLMSEETKVELKVIPTSVEVSTKPAPTEASASPQVKAEASAIGPAFAPATPGEGYRFLDPEELVVEGDEFYSPSGVWLRSVSWATSDKKQGDGIKYRRRNKFAEGELVRIVKPLRMQRGWTRTMDEFDGRADTISSIDSDGDYRLSKTPCYYRPNWLAPASSAQREEAERANVKAPAIAPTAPLPGEDYRFLDSRELVVEGDEFYMIGCGWVKSNNWKHSGSQAVDSKYRRRNKFAEGELVRIVKPLDTSVGPGWMSSFDRWIEENKVFTVTERPDGSNNYAVAESIFVFAPNWLAPASSEQRTQKAEEEAKKAKAEAPVPAPTAPATLGEGYRFLDPEELVVEGDEFYNDCGRWVKSDNWRSAERPQSTGTKYRRRNKFAQGELVRIVKPLGVKSTDGPGWVSEFDEFEKGGRVFTIEYFSATGNYCVKENSYHFVPSWLAPASEAQKEAHKKAQIAELESKIKDIQSEIDSLRK